MKKLFTLIVAFLLLGLNAYAEADKELVLSSLPDKSENTTWTMATDGSYATFAWTTHWYNSTQLFGLLDYSAYKALRIVSEKGTSDHCRLIVNFSDGTGQKTLRLDAGDQTFAIETLAGDETKISEISEIRLSGADDVIGDIKISKVVLVAGVGKAKLMPTGIDLKTLTGTEQNWANLINYPATFTDYGAGYYGNGDGSNESTHVDISAYDRIYFIVSRATNQGVALRSWFWDGTKVVTLYPYPLAQEETADFTAPYKINKPGVYVVKTNGIADLKGFKGYNGYSGSSIIVEAAYVSNGKKPMRAIDGFRHFSSPKALDFSSVNGVDAYIVPECEDGKVYMKKVTGVVPANTGLILKSELEDHLITIPGVEPFDSTLVNLLVPVAEETEITKAERGNNYLFDGEKWVAVEEATPLNAGSSYLKASSSYSLLEASYKPLSSKNPDFIDGDPSDYDPNNGLAPSDELPGGSIESPVRPENGLVTFPEEDSENADAVGTVTGIDNAQAGKRIARITTVGGAQLSKLQKGVNIVTYSDGSRATVIIK